MYITYTSLQGINSVYCADTIRWPQNKIIRYKSNDNSSRAVPEGTGNCVKNWKSRCTTQMDEQRNYVSTIYAA